MSKERKQILKEIFETEVKYFDSLDIILKIQSLIKDKNILTQNEINVIFGDGNFFNLFSKTYL